ncbi:MAG: membrane protein insertase YidC [Chlamydiales bacterium]|jgi:YidC/Oxa1 family membrane protein insertase|nr:membrane protein insertase YidC [Chlamydiales bacterium]
MNKRSFLFVLLLTVGFFFLNQWLFPPKQPSITTTETQKVYVEPTIEAKPTATDTFDQQQQQFFVLENAYQQLVFSNIGGAISEINLALYSKKNSQIPVRSIAFDRIVEKNFSQNSHFPAFPYFTNENTGEKIQPITGGYYPLLRRTLFNTQGVPISFVEPKFYALNIVSSDTNLAAQSYRLKKLEKDLIEFELIQPNRRITKTFSFSKDPSLSPYCIEVMIKIDGDTRGLWLTTGIPEVELISGNAAPTLKYRTLRGSQKAQIEQLSLPKNATMHAIPADWICNSNGFLGMILDPLTAEGSSFRAQMIPGMQIPTRLSLMNPEYQPYPPEKYPGYEMQIPLHEQISYFRLYAGPFEDDLLNKVDQTYANPAKGYNPGYIGALSFHGWFTFISEPFAKFLFLVMKFFYRMTSSWGISIILLTLVLRIMLYPLNAWSINSSLKMSQIAPQVTAIQEKYKKDPKRAQMEVMSLYREKGVNPLMGCFPLLIQLPFLIGMFDLLKSTFELRGASFIPGWIDNLTAPDVLFSWNYPIPFFGSSFHLLPFLLGFIMWIQQRFTSMNTKTTAALTDQQKQQKMMGNIMTVVFTVMFYHFPSGLNLYWLSSMGLGILQQWFMMRKMKKV